MPRKRERYIPLSEQPETGKPSAENNSVLCDGKLVGVGLSKENAEAYVQGMSATYPDSNFEIVPGGVGKPGDTEENPE